MADSTLSALPAGSALAGPELFYGVQTGADVKITANQIKTFAATGSVTPAALTAANDTNVTLTLAGTPATALLQATSITAGWAGTLANARLANMASNTLKGNNTGLAAAPIDLTVAQVNAILPVFTSALNGLAPLSGGGTTNFLRADGTWTAPPGISTLTVGTTTITGGTTTRVLYDNAGILGEYTISGSGSVAMTTSPSFTTPVLGTPTSGTLTNCTG